MSKRNFPEFKLRPNFEPEFFASLKLYYDRVSSSLIMAGIGLMYMNPQVSRHLFNNSRPVTRGSRDFTVKELRNSLRQSVVCYRGDLQLDGKEPDKSLRIELTIRNEATGFSSTYKVSDAKELRAVFRIFCKAQSPDNPAFGRYAFYYGDQIVTEDNCPYDLQMNDGDVIDAVPRMFAEMV